MAVILLATPDSKIETLMPLVPQVMAILQEASLQPGHLIKVSAILSKKEEGVRLRRT